MLTPLILAYIPLSPSLSNMFTVDAYLYDVYIIPVNRTIALFILTSFCNSIALLYHILYLLIEPSIPSSSLITSHAPWSLFEDDSESTFEFPSSILHGTKILFGPGEYLTIFYYVHNIIDLDVERLIKEYIIFSSNKNPYYILLDM